ncbi:CRISPR-associated protein Cas5 [Candidatus Methanoperedens nitroreducens]|uniref:CRISPR-associated protein Cas5 n=1 Tax=Candidatus Methanoperedens nitratireducens TaxID=1392998 RepID=A0A062V747_9EURY|nr:CRISPR-associated protein Cas5 [Candidatus Methanoperedens nitroreducens]KCZ73137.1 CRISPR-associated protein Cas5 [Candidatus Methanoperedens nitroreducens]MDJ1422914.1 CRISPR-associated protein Cas5 [Candidatus Methanoperedens sp.]
MFLFSIKGIAITASFRVPETHTFHQTLPLPPKTTIIGMIGAALGLNLENAHKYTDKNEILVSIYGKHKGMMKDLWNYRKLTGKEKNYTSEDIKNRRHYSILIREYLCYNDFIIYFASNNLDPLEELRNAMLSPVYALTAGNSDDLLKIYTISNIITLQAEKLNQFEYTILPEDVSKSYKPDVDFSLIPITQTIYTPQVFLLPTRFEFKGDERRVIERKSFTFVSTPIVVEKSIEGYIIDGKKVVLQ